VTFVSCAGRAFFLQYKSGSGYSESDGLTQYAKEVSEHTFPQPENWFGMPDEEYEELLQLFK
jgi:ketopantoate hydroxymethyltransferase